MKALLGLVGTLFAAAIILAGPAVYWLDRRPLGSPPLVNIHWLLFHWKWPGESLAAQLTKYQKAEAAALAHTKVVVIRQTTISHDAEAKEAVAQERIRTVTRTIIREVHDAIPPTVDARFALPNGLVRVHDAAALGISVSALPESAPELDGAASDVKPSEAATAIAGNYGAARANAEQLSALQDWIRQEQAATR